jgi:hypothetical protein
MGDDAAAVDALETGLMRFPTSTELQAELTLMVQPGA